MFITSLTWAAPTGPFLGTSVDTGVLEGPECDASFPYALSAFPSDSELVRLYNPLRSYGAPVTISTLMEGAAGVAAVFPHAEPLLVGDMSTRRGGALPPHRWHHDGRSADIGLYALKGGQPDHGFEVLWPSQLDVARTWTLISSLLHTGNVEHILVDRGHIRVLKAYLRENKLLDEAEINRMFPAPGTPRMWAMHGIVRHAPNHRNHLHVRIACQAD